jgi:hypothetical protein
VLARFLRHRLVVCLQLRRRCLVRVACRTDLRPLQRGLLVPRRFYLLDVWRPVSCRYIFAARLGIITLVVYSVQQWLVQLCHRRLVMHSLSCWYNKPARWLIVFLGLHPLRNRLLRPKSRSLGPSLRRLPFVFKHNQHGDSFNRD